jgi:hypothetical protein
MVRFAHALWNRRSEQFPRSAHRQHGKETGSPERGARGRIAPASDANLHVGDRRRGRRAAVRVEDRSASVRPPQPPPVAPAAGGRDSARCMPTRTFSMLNQKAAVKDAVIPSKLLTYMAAGKAVLCAANAGSEAARLVRRGAVRTERCPARGSTSALAEGALGLRADATLRRTMGINGRAYAVRNFEKARVLSLYDDFFASLLHRPLVRAAAAAD